jgi:Mg-chelatase subunit ChlD
MEGNKMTTEIAKKDMLKKLEGLRTVSSVASSLDGLRPKERVDKALIILMDISDSMGSNMGSQRKIDVLWDVLHSQLLPNMSGWTFGIIKFGDSSYWEIFPTNRTNAVALRSPNLSGMTSMGSALKMSWEWIRSSANEARIILLSDGEPNDMPKDVILNCAREVRNIPIDTVGIGSATSSYDPTFLRELSRITGGTFSEAGSSIYLAETIKKLSPANRPLLGTVKK